MFTGFGLPEMDKTIALATDTFAEANATKLLEVSDSVPKMKVQMNDTQNEIGYLFFKEAHTTVSAETYIDFTSVPVNAESRAGITLTNEDRSAQLKFYLYVPQNGTNVTKLQIYWENGFSKWGTPVFDDFLPASLANIGVKNIKMSVERDGDTYKVYVNDKQVHTGALSDIEGFEITSGTPTHIGLFGGQQSMIFHDFKYSYGPKVE